MQQPMNQQEPIGGQQMSQQMVLCPVRFVYETQVLVQPGDQIPPNQTFFINPQNPPPWMQNRPAPNPVVYVQQLPNNMVPSVQQHMDQNQLYLQQNFANFQLQQHMLAQNQQEMRPTMQIANIVPNMVQNVQQNNMSNERNIGQNVNAGQMQGNTQIIQNQLAVANNTRQIPNQPNQTVEVQRQVYMNMRPQMTQQVNITRPVMSLNQLQNMQSLTNMQNVQIQQQNVGQTFMQNIGQRPLAQNVNTVRPQAVATNIMNVQPIAKAREQTPSEANKTVSNTTAPAVPIPNVKNFTQNYNCRPIQSKRRYIPNNAAPMPKVQTQHIPVQTVPNIYTPDKSNTHQIVTNIAANTTYLNSPNILRKRKSESPDEVRNKITMIHNQIAKPIYNNNPQQNVVVTKLVNEIGTNTSPVHKPKIINNTAYQMNTNPQMIVAEKPQQINEHLIKMKEPKTTITCTPNEKEKYVRNTVYTQARGRVLQDKIEMPLQVTPTESIKNTTENMANTEVQTEQTRIVPEVNPKLALINVQKPETRNELQEKMPETIKLLEKKPVIVIEKLSETTNTSDAIEEMKIENVDSEMKEVKEKIPVEQANGVKAEELEVKLKADVKQDILTHVVDGYVIQESNFAFPIRKPLKEKTQCINPKAEESETTDPLKECMKEEMKQTVGDIPLLPFHYLLLNSEKKEEKIEENIEDNKEKNENSSPFAKLQHATVKSWTVEDLSSHLFKFNWKETVSVFQDHEIDGESLFLVSKNQLMTIGVPEEHADVICEFVKS